MRAVDMIQAKRDGQEHSEAVLREWLDQYVAGGIPDYQMAAWLMAVYFKGMTPRETAALTQVMVQSGEVVDLSDFGSLTVDKHSTGGVGDKTTLIVGPIAAAAGAKVAKMSGRGLSHTGGTIDKLESIAGFRTDLGREEFLAQVKDLGIVVAGQTANLAPADKLLYALRDVTGTVESIPLIAASIMSKKIASGARNIVLDVKVGSGAFMKTTQQAIELARAMVDIGHHLSRNVVAFVTDMNQPLGFAIGNALEIEEAVRVLQGSGPSELYQVCHKLASEMIQLALSITAKQASVIVDDVLETGAALAVLRKMIQTQGGAWDEENQLPVMPRAEIVIPVAARTQGYVQGIHALEAGRIAMRLGAGRERKGDPIDARVGIVLAKRLGDHCLPGDLLATIYAADETSALHASTEVQEAFQIGLTPPAALPLFYAKVDHSSVQRYV